jgi:hypothetical protein
MRQQSVAGGGILAVERRRAPKQSSLAGAAGSGASGSSQHLLAATLFCCRFATRKNRPCIRRIVGNADTNALIESVVCPIRRSVTGPDHRFPDCASLLPGRVPSRARNGTVKRPASRRPFPVRLRGAGVTAFRRTGSLGGEHGRFPSPEKPQNLAKKALDQKMISLLL